MTRSDLIALLSSIAAAASISASLGLGDSIDALAPGYGKKVLAVITLISVVAMVLSRLISNPSPPAGTASVVTPSPNATPVLTTPPPKA
ncbi:MAG: hypothetical protein WCE44_02585 [Candidatus Velthaea sp.]